MFQKLLLQSGFLSSTLLFLANESLLNPLYLSIIPPALHFLTLKNSAEGKKVLGKIFFFHWQIVWNLAIGWEIEYLFLDSTHECKSKKRKLAGFGNKLFLWTYSIGLRYNCCTSIKSSSAYWLGSSASGISLLSSALGLISAPWRFSFKNLFWLQEVLLLVPLYSFLFVPVY